MTIAGLPPVEPREEPRCTRCMTAPSTTTSGLCGYCWTLRQLERDAESLPSGVASYDLHLWRRLR